MQCLYFVLAVLKIRQLTVGIEVVTVEREQKKATARSNLMSTTSPSFDAPSEEPSSTPTLDPSFSLLSNVPTNVPTNVPNSMEPSFPPSSSPTESTNTPTEIPTETPTLDPTSPTWEPTTSPSFVPSVEPSNFPTNPTFSPSFRPSSPTVSPTPKPTRAPTIKPTRPTIQPSTLKPTPEPTLVPTFEPTISHVPTLEPTTSRPSVQCMLGQYFSNRVGSCQDCPVGTFSNLTGLVYSCMSCPLSEFPAASNCAPGEVLTVAGGGNSGNFADGIGTNAVFGTVYGIVEDSVGNLLIADNTFKVIRHLNLTNFMVTTIAGQLWPNAFSFDITTANGPASNAYFFSPQGLTVVGSDIYVADYWYVRRIDSTMIVSTIAGSTPTTTSPASVNGAGTNVVFNLLYRMTYDAIGNAFYLAEFKNNNIRKMVYDPKSGQPAQVTTFVSGSSKGIIYAPLSITFYNGEIYTSGYDNTINKINMNKTITVVAGQFNSRDYLDGVGTNAKLDNIYGLSFDSTGSLYMADSVNTVIRKMTPSLNVITLVGQYPGLFTKASSIHSDGFGTNANFVPSSLFMTKAGGIYFADEGTGIKSLSTGCPEGMYNPTSVHGQCENVPQGYFLGSQGSNIIYKSPSFVSNFPTHVPTKQPTFVPSNEPTASPTFVPTLEPSTFPPSLLPTLIPTALPTFAAKSHNLSTTTIALVVAFSIAGALGLLVCVLWYFGYLGFRTTVRKSISYNEKEWQTNTSNERYLAMSNPMGVSARLAKASNDNAKKFKLNFDTSVNLISWETIKILPNPVIGKGSFGVVLKAEWTNEKNQKVLVAIKILTLSLSSENSDKDKVHKQALEEMKKMSDAEEKMTYKDCIVKVYGMVAGMLSDEICDVMKVVKSEAIGIVMRFEGGGSLNKLIHDRNTNDTESLPIMEKIRLLAGVARGLAELHAAGVVHADIKPDNVLLSDSSDHPEVRLADFGQSIINEASSLSYSTLAQTSHARGTPIYSAPEMLHNPYNLIAGDKVAKASRKTDMYSFAIMAWEILSEERPFSDVYNEAVLGSKVHQGQRPPIDKIPLDCPMKIVSMIQACWDTDRSQRKSAVECFSILQYYYGLMSKTQYDIFLSHDSKTAGGLPFWVFHRLTQLGYRVWFHQPLTDSVKDEREHDKSVMAGIASSKAFVLFASSHYQNHPSCMEQLSIAKQASPPIPIVPLFLHADFPSWAGQDLNYLCQLRSPKLVYFDLSLLAEDDWSNEDDGSVQVIELHRTIDQLINHLIKLSCLPMNYIHNSGDGSSTNSPSNSPLNYSISSSGRNNFNRGNSSPLNGSKHSGGGITNSIQSRGKNSNALTFTFESKNSNDDYKNESKNDEADSK